MEWTGAATAVVRDVIDRLTAFSAYYFSRAASDPVRSAVYALLALLILFSSAAWTAHICRARYRKPVWHIPFALLAPLAYPLLLLLALPRKRPREEVLLNNRAPMTASGEIRRAKIPFPEYMKRRTIGREPLVPSEAEETIEISDPKPDVEPYQAYFARMLRHNKGQLNPPLHIAYKGGEVVARRIVELMPACLVIESRRSDEAPLQCIRIPYHDILRCQVLRK